VSNYVMLDVGQPNHAYDLDRLGGGGLLIRRGRPGEALETLDGMTRVLQDSDCVIADANGVAVGVGGIMGGASAEIGAATTRVLLEAAWFSPMAVARTGKRLGLHSEARVRFERGVDPQIAGVAVERFVALLGGDVRRGPTVDVVDDRSLPAPPSVRLRTKRVNAIMGTSLADDDVVRLLEPIGFSTSSEAAGVLSVTIPSWRLDSEREIDVIEEVGRMWGFRRVERTLPSGIRATGLSPYQRGRRRVRDILAGAGYDEAWTTSFLAPGDLERAGLDGAAVEVENPLDRSESIMRTALLPGLLKAVKANVDRQVGDVCLFEIGKVFGLPPDGSDLPAETEALGVIVCPAGAGGEVGGDAAGAAARTWRYLGDALRLADMRMSEGALPGWHPSRGARLVGSTGVVLGGVGEVDPSVAAAYGLDRRAGYLELSLEALLAEPQRAWQAVDVSRFPASDIDLAFVLDDAVPAAAVRATLSSSAEGIVESVVLFDVYRGASMGEGRRSLAFRIRYRAPDRTLSESELAAAREAAIEAVGDAHGGVLRG
jgi:phenylalanyl-tRNA synthetase beta chain